MIMFVASRPEPQPPGHRRHPEDWRRRRAEPGQSGWFARSSAPAPRPASTSSSSRAGPCSMPPSAVSRTSMSQRWPLRTRRPTSEPGRARAGRPCAASAAYKLLLSPCSPAPAGSHPSCSHYMVEAIRVHGAPTRRLARHSCGWPVVIPSGRSAFDPVPPRPRQTPARPSVLHGKACSHCRPAVVPRPLRYTQPLFRLEAACGRQAGRG